MTNAERHRRIAELHRSLAEQYDALADADPIADLVKLLTPRTHQLSQEAQDRLDSLVGPAPSVRGVSGPAIDLADVVERLERAEKLLGQWARDDAAGQHAQVGDQPTEPVPETPEQASPLTGPALDPSIFESCGHTHAQIITDDDGSIHCPACEAEEETRQVIESAAHGEASDWDNGNGDRPPGPSSHTKKKSSKRSRYKKAATPAKTVGKRRNIVWDDDKVALLGTATDADVGNLLGCTSQAIMQQRAKRNIPPFNYRQAWKDRSSSGESKSKTTRTRTAFD